MKTGEKYFYQNRLSNYATMASFREPTKYIKH